MCRQALLSEMLAFGHRPDRAAYQLLMECYSQHADQAAALAVFDRMEAAGLVPNRATYNACVSSSCWGRAGGLQ